MTKSPILKEYYRGFGNANEHSSSMKFHAREFKAVSGNDYSITARFESQDGEKIFGMGQYQQPELDLKGCVLELAAAEFTNQRAVLSFKQRLRIFME